MHINLARFSIDGKLHIFGFNFVKYIFIECWKLWVYLERIKSTVKQNMIEILEYVLMFSYVANDPILKNINRTENVIGYNDVLFSILNTYFLIWITNLLHKARWRREGPLFEEINWMKKIMHECADLYLIIYSSEIGRRKDNAPDRTNSYCCWKFNAEVWHSMNFYLT